MAIKTTLIMLAGWVSLPAMAHVSNSTAQLHQAEHLLWALALVPVAWVARPAIKKIIARSKSR